MRNIEKLLITSSKELPLPKNKFTFLDNDQTPKKSIRKSFGMIVIPFLSIIVTVCLLVHILVGTGAVYIAKAESPNADFVECAGELGTLFMLNSSFGEESRKQLLDDLKMPMEMYMKLEDLEAVYELYWHQHQYSQNAELDMSRRGIISLSEQEIINKYLEEYQTKYVEYNYKIKEVLGKRYNDFTHWFVDWKGRFASWQDNNSNNDVVFLINSSETEEERNIRLQKHMDDTDKADEVFENNLKSVCKSLNFSKEQEYYINQIFNDYNYICRQAYTLYECRMSRFGVESKAHYVELRENLVNDFLDKTYEELKNLLGDEFDSFKPFFNDLAEQADRPYFFQNVDYQ